MSSTAGIAWRNFYEAEGLSWIQPEAVGRAHLERLARSDWVRLLLSTSGTTSLEGTQLLEAGCGTGQYAAALTCLGYRVRGFDFNQRAIQYAVAIRRRAGLDSSAAQFEVGDLLASPYPENCFDLVFNQAVIEYLCDDPELETSLREMVRVLRPGGKLALIVQNTRHPLRHVKAILGWPGFVGQPPVRQMSARELCVRLKRLGLVKIVADGIEPWKGVFHGIPALTRTRRAHDLTYLMYRGLTRLIPLPRALRSQLAVQYIVAARKPSAS